MKLQHLEGDTGQQMAQLDSRTRQIIDDLKNNISTYQSHADVEREKLEGKLFSVLDNHAQIRDELIVSYLQDCCKNLIVNFLPNIKILHNLKC